MDKLITGVLAIVTFVIWLVLLDIATTKLLLVFSSQFVGLAFMIGSTCKNIFESFVFVFVMHPYDVGDRCVVDGVMVMNFASLFAHYYYYSFKTSNLICFFS